MSFLNPKHFELFEKLLYLFRIKTFTLQEDYQYSSMSEFINGCYADLQVGNIIVAYKGEINPEIISDTLELVESKLDIELSHNNRVRKKIYNVLVECLQNLYHHVDTLPGEQNSNLGVFILSKCEGEGYRISTGNMVQVAKKDALKEKIDRINKMGREELKEFYKFVLNNQTFSDKGGGGLGLIDIARKTGGKLDYRFIPYNAEYDFFTLSVVIMD